MNNNRVKDEGRSEEVNKIHMRTWDINPAPIYPKLIPMIRSEVDRLTRFNYIPRDCDLRALVNH